MSLQALLTAIALPPLLFVLLAMAGALLMLRWRRLGAALVLGAGFGILLLATPVVEDLLRAPLERAAMAGPLPAGVPRAIIVLGGDGAHGAAGLEVGALTLERLRAGAALQRSTGLPLLVTGGPFSAGQVPLALLMQRSLNADFRLPVRWVEGAAADTRDNAALSAAMLRADGIEAAYLVTHAWHMARAREAFARVGLAVQPVPVRLEPAPPAQLSSWIPRPDRLVGSWYMIREWVGRAVYAWRDG